MKAPVYAERPSHARHKSNAASHSAAIRTMSRMGTDHSDRLIVPMLFEESAIA